MSLELSPAFGLVLSAFFIPFNKSGISAGRSCVYFLGSMQSFFRMWSLDIFLSILPCYDDSLGRPLLYFVPFR